MAPPMPSHSKRMTANPARPVARYRPGKPVQEDSSSDESESQSEEEAEKRPTSKTAQPKASSFPSGARLRQVAAQRTQQGASEDEEGFVTEEENESDRERDFLSRGNGSTAHVSQAHTGAATRPPKPAEESPNDDTVSEESEEETSEEEEDSSEEDVPQRTFQRPTFIKKSERGKPLIPVVSGFDAASTNHVPSTSPGDGSVAAETARRKEMANLMIKDKLERDAAARAAGRKGWDDADEVAPEDMVDDTDGLDPEVEYAAWKLRELKRLKRDREAIEQREKEIEEIERRRNLTQDQREAEDKNYLKQQKEDREEGRGKAGFLQRYHHKGAFFQDDETAEVLRKRDLMGAKFVDEVQHRETLPQYMQIRDMTRLGKKGRTRYTDLKGEDTGKWGQGYNERERKGPWTDFGVDERFRADQDVGGRTGPTGANASAVRDRRDMKLQDAPEGLRRRRDASQARETEVGADSYRPRSRSGERNIERGGRARRRSPSPRPTRFSSRSRSRSRSTGRYRGSRRKRSPSPHRNLDKRQRVEAS